MLLLLLLPTELWDFRNKVYCQNVRETHQFGFVTLMKFSLYGHIQKRNWMTFSGSAMHTILTQVNYYRGKILHAYGDIAGHCGRFGAKSDWLNL